MKNVVVNSPEALPVQSTQHQLVAPEAPSAAGGPAIEVDPATEWRSRQCIITWFGGGNAYGPLVAHAKDIAQRESRFDPAAINHEGCVEHGIAYQCYGLFQLHGKYAPKWFNDMGLNFYTQWSDPCANAQVAKHVYLLDGWGPWGG